MRHEELLMNIRTAFKKTHRYKEYERDMLFNEVIRAARGEEITIRLKRLNKKGSGA